MAKRQIIMTVPSGSWRLIWSHSHQMYWRCTRSPPRSQTRSTYASAPNSTSAYSTSSRCPQNPSSETSTLRSKWPNRMHCSRPRKLSSSRGRGDQELSSALETCDKVGAKTEILSSKCRFKSTRPRIMLARLQNSRMLSLPSISRAHQTTSS